MTNDDLQTGLMLKVSEHEAYREQRAAYIKETWKNEPAVAERKLAVMNAAMDDVIDTEWDHYSTVMVRKRKSGWYLCYAGCKPGEGTGPFYDRICAENFFITGGR